MLAVMTGCNYGGGDTHASNGSDMIVLEEVEKKEEPSLAIEFPPFFDMSRKEIISEFGGEQSVKGYGESNKAGEIIRLEDLPYRGCRISVDFYNRKSDWKPRNLRIWFPIGDAPKSLTEATRYIRAISGGRISDYEGFYAFDEGGCQYKRALGEEGTFEIKFFEEGQYVKEAILTFHHTLANPAAGKS